MNTSSEINGNGHFAPAYECRLDLIVKDRDVVEELQRRTEPAERSGYAQGVP